MDPIDFHYGKLKDLIASLDPSGLITESDTRLKIIDPMLADVLGWPVKNTQTSEAAGTGFIDYALHIDDCVRLVVEAKKDSLSFELEDRKAGQAYKLNGPTFETSAKAAIDQAIRYNAFKNAELACVTNGREWIIFRANRLGDGHDTLSGKGFVFTSLQSILDNFSLFFGLLSRTSVSELGYRGYFQEVEGIPLRDLSFLKPLRTPDANRVLSRGSFGQDIDAIMGSFFTRLKGDHDPDMIQKCFVVTNETNLAEQRISRIAVDLVNKVKALHTGTGDQLLELIRAVQSQQRNRFVLLVGNKGSGKSTFIERFFKHILPEDTAKWLVPIKVDLSLSEGDPQSIVSWLNKTLLTICEQAVFTEESPSWDETVGAMFYDVYQRWSRGSMKHLYDSDKVAFKVKFGDHIEQIRAKDPHEYIQRLLRHIVHSRKKIPCIILDNTDHFTIPFQEAVFQYARSIYESELCLVIIPITDRTSWQLSRQGATQSFESEALSLPIPSPERIIERRIAYLIGKLRLEDIQQTGTYFIGRGIELDIKHIGSFVEGLNKIFIETKSTSALLGSLANYDVRRLLELTKDVMASPQLPLDDLFKAHITKSAVSIPEYKIRNAIIKRKYELYPMGNHPYVQNLYALCLDVPASPLVGVRVLQYLFDAQAEDNRERSFVPVDVIYEYLTSIGIQNKVTTHYLEALLLSGLIFEYDPTVTAVEAATRVEISPSGITHLNWSTTDEDYIKAMRDVTPVRDKRVYDELKQCLQDGYSQTWKKSISAFMDYLVAEDEWWCQVPTHRIYDGQRRVTQKIVTLKNKILSH